jgi:hypothetical protein
VGVIARLAAVAMVVSSAFATPAYAKATFVDIQYDFGGSNPVQVPNTAGGALVTTDPVPTPSGFVWTVSGAGLFWFDDTVTAAPGGTGGTVIVRKTDGGTFQFAGIEYGLFSTNSALELFPLLVQGFSGGGVLASTQLTPTALGSYQAFGPGGLAGILVDELRFAVDGARTTFDEDQFPIRNEFAMSIRRLALDTGGNTTVVPEPQTWALLIAGFALTGAALRRRRSAFA